jgi:hypothetical protein
MPRSTHTHGSSVCFYPHVYLRVRVAFWPLAFLSLLSGAFPMRSRGLRMKESRQIFVQDLILYQGRPLIYIMSFMGSGSERAVRARARVCQQERESD